MAEYIEREALLAAYDAAHEGAPGRARKLMVDAPAADVVPVRRGRWIDGADSFGAKRGEFRVCSRCNICFPRDDRVTSPQLWRGCPNCFSRMDGE